MRKAVLVLAIFLFNFALGQEVIQLGAKYDETSARQEAFLDIERKIQKEFYKKYLKDPNRIENLDFINRGIFDTKKGRYLCPFYLKNTLASYAVVYDDTMQYVFYYNILGSLIKFDIINKQTYPRKTLGYSRFGNLISVSFEASENEQFVYDDNGKLIAHWIYDTVLDGDDRLPRFFKLK